MVFAFVIFVGIIISSQGREITTPFEIGPCKCVRDESVGPSWEKKVYPLFSKITHPDSIGKQADTISWILKDSFSTFIRIPSSGRAVISFNPDIDTIEIISIPDTFLSSLSEQAIEHSPEWLKDELRDNLIRLGDKQNVYAELILNSFYPYLDEIAFCVARLGVETLIDSTFDPNLIIENVKFLYKNDSLLDYVDIIDYSDYSTTRYRVIENEDTILYELPKEYYYWYIVHPQISDESPRMDSKVYDKFWREYLFYEADLSYPLLSEKLKGVKILWLATDTSQYFPADRDFDSTQTALDVIGNWGTRTVPVMATDNRPIQPNIIAHEHNGNCGELQDLSCAASRACLIPNVCAMDICEDHVWNEFYYKGWLECQLDRGFGPTHINAPQCGYDEQYGGSKRISSVWDWRSDGNSFDVTHRYSNSCSLHVEILDKRGLPVDGARVYVFTEYYYLPEYLYYTTWRFTDSRGRCGFELGDLRNFYVGIISRIGNYPKQFPQSTLDQGTIKVISESQSGADYYKAFYIDSLIEAPWIEYKEPTPSDSPPYKLELKLSTPYEILHGYCGSRRDCGDTIGLTHTWIEKVKPGNISYFILDSLNYNHYINKEPFESPFIGSNVEKDSSSFIIPDFKKWYLVISNENKLTTSEGVEFSLNLYKNPIYGIEEIVSISQPFLKITPNPFTTEVSVQWLEISTTGGSASSGSEGQKASLRIYDLSGRLVKSFSLTTNHLPLTTGVVWDGKDKNNKKLPSGVYFCKLNTKNYNKTKKIILMK
ncbi:T9SS type A sorting domain-containing protein [candidate division WOR-3 bacterium]|nr:T9SS type A sorting domain-containing protein [candidate division WOR-3 bacterium]